MIRDIINRVKLFFQTEKELRCALHNILGFYPGDIRPYRIALKHRSLNEGENNERLEFLGDAILNAVVGDIVYRNLVKGREGQLTQTRSRIVSRESLGQLSHEMGLDRLVRSNLSNETSHNSYMAGNAFEALVGAIYLDRGYAQCMHFMQSRAMAVIGSVESIAKEDTNPKSRLLEWAQKRHLDLRFELEQHPDPDPSKSSPVFSAVVFLRNVRLGEGTGYSKKQATQKAARETLNMLKRPEVRSLLRRERP